MEAEIRSFQGIWIDAGLWKDDNLSATQKFLFKEIESLDHGKGCYKKIEELARCAGITRRQAQYHIRILINKGYIFDAGCDGRRRYLKVLNTMCARGTKTAPLALGCAGGTKNAPQTYEKRTPEIPKLHSAVYENYIKGNTENNHVALDFAQLSLSDTDLIENCPTVIPYFLMKPDATAPETFFDEVFWPIYPRHRNRFRALEKFRELKLTVIQALNACKSVRYLWNTDWKKRPLDRIEYACTFLAEKRFEDDEVLKWKVFDAAHEKKKADDAKREQDRLISEAAEAKERLKKERLDNDNNEKALLYYFSLSEDKKNHIRMKAGEVNRFKKQTIDADPEGRTAMMFIVDHIIKHEF
jgi:hypothetical protein